MHFVLSPQVIDEIITSSLATLGEFTLPHCHSFLILSVDKVLVLFVFLATALVAVCCLLRFIYTFVFIFTKNTLL